MFRFTIRDVLWLTVVVGMGCGWLMDHAEQSSLAGALRMRADERGDKANDNYTEMMRLRKKLDKHLPGWEALP